MEIKHNTDREEIEHIKYTLVKNGAHSLAIVEVTEFLGFFKKQPKIVDIKGKIIGYQEFFVKTKHGWVDEYRELFKERQISVARNKNKPSCQNRKVTPNLFKGYDLGSIVHVRSYL